MSGSMTLTPTGLHDFTRPLSAPFVNGMHDPARFVRIVFEWENGDLYFDPPQHLIGLADDTTEPSITSFTLAPNTVNEGGSVGGVVTLDNSSSVPQIIDFAVVGSVGPQYAVTLPWYPLWGYHVNGATEIGVGQSSAAVVVGTVHDNPTGNKNLDISATARWNTSAAIAQLTIVDLPYGPSKIPALISGTFVIPEDRSAGDVVGSVFDGADGSAVSVQVISNTGPFAISLSGATEGYITYTGNQDLVVG